MSQQTLPNKVLFRRTLRAVWVGLFVVLLAFASLAFVAIAPKAQAATSSTINFQARLLQSNGSLVADGFYNVQFKLYTAASGGSAVWTETYYDSDGVTVGNDNRARVVNGYLSVNLGSQTAFGGSINWDQEHWITMNVGGTTQTATPTWDGEMDPRLKLTGVPYAFTAGQLNKTTGGLTSVLGWANQTAANSILLPDDSGTICLQNDASCGFMAGSAGDYIQNGTTPQTADLNITGSATVGSLLTSTVDTAAAGTLTIGGTNATAITIADDTTISAGLSLTITGGATGTRPASPTEGMMYFDTTTKQLLTYSNGKWQADKSDAILVAASDSSQADKDAAQYVADGEIGDGQTTLDGDQVEINQALTAGAGKKVVLLAGTYTADATILIPNNTTLAGVGTGTVIQLADIDVNDNLIQNSDAVTGTDITIRDLKLVGQETLNTVGTQRGIYFSGVGTSSDSSKSNIYNLVISNFRNEGIYLSNSTRITVMSNVLFSNSSGIFLSGSTFNTLSSNVMHSNGEGVWLTGNSNNNSLGNNISRNNYSPGYKFSDSSWNTVADNTSAYNGQGGIHLSGSIKNSFTGNTLTSNTNWGVYTNDASNDNIFSNNVIGSSYYGMAIYSSERNIITSNFIADTGNDSENKGIWISGSNSNSIINNTITDIACGTGSTTCFAINISSSTSSNNYISNNLFSDTDSNATAIINDLGTGTIYSNQLDHNGVLMNRSSGGFTVQNTSGEGILTADVTAGSVVLGQSSALDGKLVLANATNTNTITLATGVTSASYTLTLPTALGSSGDCLADTTGTGVLGFTTCGGGGSGVTTVGAIDTQTKSANGAVIDGTTIYLQTADASSVGLVSTTTQTFAGAKTFNNTVTIATDQGLVLTGGTSRPGTTEGTLFYDTSTDQLLVYANGKWQADRTDAILVAANDSSQAAKDAADYVADGTDDQVQINDALADANPAGTGRKLGKVYLFAGTYTTHRTASSDATIFIPNNTTLAGAGRGTLVRFGDIDATDYLIQNADISTGTGVVVRDMMIDGQKTLNTVGTQHGIYFANMGDGGGASAQRGGVIENIQAVSFSGTGIVLSSSNNNVIHANTIESSYGGVLLDASLYNKISGNSAHNSTYAGIQLQSSSSSNNIADNQIHTSANAGIRIQSTSAYNSVTGNQISGSTSYGMYISTIGNTVSSNEITGSSYGMVLPVGSGGNTMVANNIRNTTVDGIAVQNSSGNTISDNTIQNSTDEGLVLDAESHNNVLTGNVIDTTGGSGIQITGVSGDEPTNNTVSGNSILNSGGSTTNYGIELVYAHKNTLANNRITDTSCTNNCYAISINANSTTNYISNNAFDSTSGTPTINDAGTGTIYSNQIDDAGVLMNRSSGGFEVQTTAGASLLNVNSSASTVSIDGAVDIQVNSSTAFVVQNSSSDALFTVDTSNNQIVVGDVSGAPTLFVVGSKTTDGDPASGVNGAMYYNSFMNQFRCYVNGAWASCAGSGSGGGSTRKVTLIPEFAGGTLQADGSNNAGVMSANFVSGLAAVQGYKHNYYQWTTSNTAAQDYNIVVNTQIPSEYASTLTNLKVWGYTSSTTLATATIQFTDTDGTACYASPVSITPSTASTWEEKSVGAMSGCTFAANDIVTITIVVAAEDDAVFRVGEVSFEYTN